MNRVNVVGTSGSGKSTFARRLALAMDAPYVELDKVFWGPNWTEPTDEVLFAKLTTELDRPRWVLDGNFTRTLSIKWKNVESVIWIDYPIFRTVWQVTKRAIHRAWTQDELWEGTGNRESFRQSFFSRKSIIWWSLSTHAKNRRQYEKMIQDSRFSHIQFIRLRSPSETERFLRQMSAQQPTHQGRN